MRSSTDRTATVAAARALRPAGVSRVGSTLTTGASSGPAPDAQAIHDALVADGMPIAAAPIDGPFGRTFTLVDPDVYQITLHDRA